MEQAVNPPTGARRNEDIALDLFKFVASTAGVGRAASPSTTGFAMPSAAKTEDQVEHLLELYTKCLKTVAGEE